MTSYQKLKEENEKLKERFELAANKYDKCYDALFQISGLKGPECLKAPEIAWNLLMDLRK